MHNFHDIKNKVNNFRKGSFIDPYDEPVFLTFALDFHFENLNNSVMDPIECSPLFETPDSTNSAQAYLGSNQSKRKGREKALSTFKDILKYLTYDAPWYFQEIRGLDNMWEASTNMNKGTKSTVITIETLEAIDLRITELASLYRNAIYDKQYMREVVPENLRWFAMDIYVAETRNMRYEIPGAGGNLANAMGIGGTVNALVSNVSNITAGFGLDVTSTMEQFGFIKFKCRQCEFDFSKSFAGGQSMSIVSGSTPAKNQFDIKIGYFEEETEFYDDTKLYDNQAKSEVKDPWAARNRMRDASDALNSVSNLPFVANARDAVQSRIQNTLTGIGGAINPALGAAANLLAPAVNTLGQGGGRAEYTQPTAKNSEDVYQTTPVLPVVNGLGDIYPSSTPGAPINDIGDIYSDSVPGAPVNNIGDIYPSQPTLPSVSEIGDIYPDLQATPPVNSLGDIYP
jgi:hypothetical protein